MKFDRYSGHQPAAGGSGWPQQHATCVASGYTDPTLRPDSTGGETTRPFNAKFPYLSNIFQMGNVYRSNYNGLQVTLNSRNFHGLSMVAGYTYSHALDDVGANWDFGYGYGLPQDSTNVGANTATAISMFVIGSRFRYLPVSGKERLRADVGRMGDQHHCHPCQLTILGTD